MFRKEKVCVGGWRLEVGGRIDMRSFTDHVPAPIARSKTARATTKNLAPSYRINLPLHGPKKYTARSTVSQGSIEQLLKDGDYLIAVLVMYNNASWIISVLREQHLATYQVPKIDVSSNVWRNTNGQPV